MEWWIEEEVNKYKNKKVVYMDSVYAVKEVFWIENTEEFIYWIEGTDRNLKKVFENDIELV